jgi:predicted O-linked N-acetylglucosamine transferase (SPINDLY family)
MSTISEALQIAAQHHQAGRLELAAEIYRRILAVAPDHPDALQRMGVLAHQIGQPAVGVECFRRAMAADPSNAEVIYNLGLALEQQGDRAGAIEAYRRALAVAPDFAQASNNLGSLLREQGRLDEALACYTRAIELQPGLAEAHSNLGIALSGQGKLREAADCFRRAAELEPDQALFHYNLGTTLDDLRQREEAVACYRRALRLNPAMTPAYIRLGSALQAQGRLDEAVACLRQAIALDPSSAVALNNLGNVLRRQAAREAAIDCYQRAVALKPDYADAYNNLGNAWDDLGRFEEAIGSYQRAIALAPGLAVAHSNLGNAWKGRGRLDTAVACFREALRLQPDFSQAHSNLVYTLNFCPGVDARAIRDECRRWNQQHAEPLARSIEPHRNERHSDRRLRVGYVAPDFRQHVQSFFTLPLLAAHDHRQFEIFCYADVTAPDDVTARLRTLPDVWRDITGISDEQVAQQVRDDRIDILVDLTLHMDNHRLLVFARKPAPVQVSWLAYPGTTGVRTIDYRLTDPYLDPPGQNDELYTEQSVRLPDTFWCYDPLTDGPPVNALPAIANGYVTFGCLNNFCKVNAEVLRVWAEVLRAVERSQMLILVPERADRLQVLRSFEAQGVAGERIRFAALQPRPQYLQRYHEIDIALDTFPYNGHTTSLDCFWMGVPVVTLAGPTVVGRGGLSQLTNLGLTELIARTPEQFVRIAADLAGDLPGLAQLRAALRARLRQSPLMDAPRFARNVEAAYRAMWRRWCEPAAPADAGDSLSGSAGPNAPSA